MITNEDIVETEHEAHAVGDYVITHCQRPLSAALAGVALVRAYINNEMPESKQLFLELIAASGDDVREVLRRHVKPRGAG